MKTRICGVLAICVLTLSFSGCSSESERFGSEPLPPGLAAFVYTANSLDNTIGGASVDSDGNVEDIPGSPFDSEGVFPTALAMSSDNHFLYVANEEDSTLTTFAIDQETGALTLVGEPLFVGWINEPPVAAVANGQIPSEEPASPISAFVTPDGNLLILGTEAGYVFVYSLDGTTGEPTEEYIEFAEAGFTAFADYDGLVVGVDFFGSVVMMDISDEEIDFLDFDGLDLEEPYAANVVVSPDGFFYVSAVEGEVDDLAGLRTGRGGDSNLSFGGPAPGFIFAFGFDEGEDDLFMLEVEDNPFEGGFSPDGMAISPDGDTLYVVYGGETEGFVVTFDINEDGSLTEVDETSAGTGGTQALAMDSTGSFLAVANIGDDTVSVFFVEDDGSLTEVEGSPFEAGALPLAIVSTR